MNLREERKKVFLRALSNTAFDRVNLGVLAAIAGGGMVFQSAPFLMMAAGGYLSAVVADLTRSDAWRRAAAELRSEPPVLPPASDYDSPTSREMLGRLDRARTQRATLAARSSTPYGDPREVELQERAVAVEAAALRALAALDRVTTYLADQAPALLRREVGRLQELAHDASSAEARADYERALALLTSRLHSIEQIEERRGVIHAKLEAMIGFLEILPVEVMKLDLLKTSGLVLEDEPSLGRLAEELETIENAARAIARPL
jgi:hypothetical protein